MREENQVCDLLGLRLTEEDIVEYACLRLPGTGRLREVHQVPGVKRDIQVDFAFPI